MLISQGPESHLHHLVSFYAFQVALYSDRISKVFFHGRYDAAACNVLESSNVYLRTHPTVLSCLAPFAL